MPPFAGTEKCFYHPEYDVAGMADVVAMITHPETGERVKAILDHKGIPERACMKPPFSSDDQPKPGFESLSGAPPKHGEHRLQAWTYAALEDMLDPGRPVKFAAMISFHRDNPDDNYMLMECAPCREAVAKLFELRARDLGLPNPELPPWERPSPFVARGSESREEPVVKRRRIEAE